MLRSLLLFGAVFVLLSITPYAQENDAATTKTVVQAYTTGDAGTGGYAADGEAEGYSEGRAKAYASTSDETNVVVIAEEQLLISKAKLLEAKTRVLEELAKLQESGDLSELGLDKLTALIEELSAGLDEIESALDSLDTIDLSALTGLGEQGIKAGGYTVLGGDHIVLDADGTQITLDEAGNVIGLEVDDTGTAIVIGEDGSVIELSEDETLTKTIEDGNIAFQADSCTVTVDSDGNVTTVEVENPSEGHAVANSIIVIESDGDEKTKTIKLDITTDEDSGERVLNIVIDDEGNATVTGEGYSEEELEEIRKQVEEAANQVEAATYYDSLYSQQTRQTTELDNLEALEELESLDELIELEGLDELQALEELDELKELQDLPYMFDFQWENGAMPGQGFMWSYSEEEHEKWASKWDELSKLLDQYLDAEEFAEVEPYLDELSAWPQMPEFSAEEWTDWEELNEDWFQGDEQHKFFIYPHGGMFFWPDHGPGFMFDPEEFDLEGFELDEDFEGKLDDMMEKIKQMLESFMKEYAHEAETHDV